MIDTAPASPTTTVQPLVCGTCQAAIPIGDGDTMQCPFCHASVAIPENYRVMRDVNTVAAADRGRVAAAYAQLGTPPGAFFRWWAGIARVVWYVVAPFSLLTLLFYVSLGHWVADALTGRATKLGLDVVDVWTPWIFCAVFAGGLNLVWVLPLILGRYRQVIAELRAQLGANSAASPPTTPGGPAVCRVCGAPLAVKPGALGVRCGYCGSDNLVALDAAWVGRWRVTGEQQHKDITTQLDVERRRRLAARSAAYKQTAWAALVLGLTVLIWHRLVVAGSVPDNWRHDVAQSPRPVIAYNGWYFADKRQLHSDQSADFDITDDYCGFHAGLSGKICALEFAVPLHRGEVFGLSSRDFPRGTVMRASSGRLLNHWDIAFSYYDQPRIAFGEFTAPYDGWFRITVAPAGLAAPARINAYVVVKPPHVAK